MRARLAQKKAGRCRQGPEECLWGIRRQRLPPASPAKGTQDLIELWLRNALDTKPTLGPAWNEAVC